MKKLDISKAVYLLIIILVFTAAQAFAQIKVEQFNAGWNDANTVSWVQNLTDCKTIGYTDIAVVADAQTKYKIAVVPTIIIFHDGEEIKRYQANIMMQIEAKLEDIQNLVDETVMNSF